MRKKADGSGWTLTEVLVAAALSGGVTLGVGTAVWTSLRHWKGAENVLEVSRELQRAVEAISRELAGARTDSLSVEPDGRWDSQITFRVPQDRNGNGTPFNAAGQPEWSEPIRYALGGEGGRQLIRTQGGASRVLANGTTELRFRRRSADPQLVEMEVSVERGGRGATGVAAHARGVSTRIRVRN